MEGLMRLNDADPPEFEEVTIPFHYKAMVSRSGFKHDKSGSCPVTKTQG